MRFDYPTLAVVLGLIMAARVAVTTSLRQLHRGYEGVGLLAAGAALTGVGFLLLFLRFEFGWGTWTAFPQNVALVTGVALEYAGGQEFTGGRVRWAPLQAGLAAFAAVIGVLSFLPGMWGARTVLLHLTLAALSFMTASVYLRARMPAIRSLASFVAVVFAISGAFYLMVAAVSAPLVGRPDPATMPTPQVAELFVVLAQSTLLTFGYVMMVGQRLTGDATAAREHFALLHETSPVPTAIVAMDGTIVRVNQSFLQMTGKRREELVGASTVGVVWTDDDLRHTYLDELAEWGEVRGFPLEIRGADGSPVQVLLSSRRLDLDGVPHILGIMQDVTEQKRLEGELESQARTDPLTAIPNRRHFSELAETELARARRSHAPLALMLVDLDHFKAINDTHGHAAGDRVLTEFADACRQCLRASDVVARHGGDEFVVLLPETDVATACAIAERVRTRSHGIRIGESPRTGRVTCSIGLAVGGDGGEPVEVLLSRADAALYAAKSMGRDRVECDATVRV